MAVGGSGKGIQIVVGADYNDRDLKRAQRDLDALKAKAAQTATPMQKLGNTLRANVGPALALAGAAAAAFAVKLAVDGVQAAAAEEKQLAVLKQTLDNVGQGFAMDEVNTFIDNLRFATGVADDELRPAFMKLVGATKDASSAQDLLKASVDASIGSGKDLSAVSMAVAKAVSGSSTALKRLIPELDATALKGGGAAKVVSVLTSRFGGSAAAAAGTFAGQLQRVQDGFMELQESFGKGFLSQLNAAKSGADAIAQALRDAQPEAEALGKAIGSLLSTSAGAGDNANVFGYVLNQNLNQVTSLITAVEYAWNGMVAAVTGSWPEDETQQTTKSVQAMAYQIENSGKGAGIMAEMFGSEAAPATMQLGDAAASSSDAMLLLREDIRLTTSSLGPLAAAFDEANAAMDRRESMQNYREALKAYIAEPSKETMAGVESAMIGAAESFTDPTKQAKFTKQAIDEITTAAKNAGQNVPPEFQAINSAAAIALDPVAKLKQNMEEIPPTINSTITVETKYVTSGTPGPYGGKPAVTGEADGGLVTGGGTSTSDSIPRMLSNGEFVVRAAAVRKFGAGLFSHLNAGINPLDGMSVSAGRRSGGFSIGSINVTAAPGESAEQSLPRALRRTAFLAGI